MVADQLDCPSDVLVIFGITGDLAQKMTFRALYLLEHHQHLSCPIIGIAHKPVTTHELTHLAYEAIACHESVDQVVFKRLMARIHYRHGDAHGPILYEQLRNDLHPFKRPLFYLETPPNLFISIISHLGQAGLLNNARVAIEKPFGHDLASARHLNTILHHHLHEEQILRIDHFLGKQPVVELEYLRFANYFLAELWNRRSISEIHITMAENFGVTERGSFYDSVGALRDVVQNHLLQVLALVTMEPPVGPTPDDLNDKKVELFRSMRPLNPRHYIRGQYDGYRNLPGVAADSQTETYVALRMEIDNWRWFGVPIFLRAGKALPYKITQVSLFLHRSPELAFLPGVMSAATNQIILRIDPDPGMRLELSARVGENWQEVHLDCSYAHDLGEPIYPYQLLLEAALHGDRQLFARQDVIEETWRLVQPLLDDPGPLYSYPIGSWGPAQANDLLKDHYSWQPPWIPS